MRADSLGQFSTRRRGSRNNLDRDTYLRDAAQYTPRGQDLPQTKLLDMDVIDIRSAKRQREALAKRYGVHQRTIEKALSRETHCALP